MKTYQPRLPLNEDLEKAVMCGILDGDISYDKLHLDELSQEGKYVLKSLKELGSRNKQCSFKTVFLHATEVLGADPESFKVYLKQVEKAEVEQLDSILDALAR